VGLKSTGSLGSLGRASSKRPAGAKLGDNAAAKAAVAKAAALAGSQAASAPTSAPTSAPADGFVKSDNARGGLLGGQPGFGGPLGNLTGGKLGEVPPAADGSPIEFSRTNPTVEIGANSAALKLAARPTLPMSAGLIGLTGGKPPPPPPPQQRAAHANTSLAAPPADHPYSKHIADVQSRLAAKDLPTTAEGVRVRVVGDQPGHGDAVTRTIGGPVGIAPNADLGLAYQRDRGSSSLKRTPQEAERMETAKALQRNVQAGTATVDESVQLSLGFGEEMLQRKRTELQGVRDELPKDGKTSIVNMSWGMSAATLADRVAQDALSSPEGSPLRQQLAKEMGRESFDAGDGAAVAAHLTPRIAAALSSDAGRAQLDPVKKRLGEELLDARKDGVLVVMASGNAQSAGAKRGDGQFGDGLVNDLPGLLNVGATHVNNPTTAADDTLAGFSSGGHVDVSAPGTKVPVGEPHTMAPRPKGFGGGGMFGNGFGGPLAGAMQKAKARNVNGTSFSAPYVAGTAALMVKANPSLTPDNIEAILKDPRVAHDIGGTQRDGAGVIDPVAAVELARDWGL